MALALPRIFRHVVGLVITLSLANQAPSIALAIPLISGSGGHSGICKTAGGAIGRINLSTKLQSRSVTLCADWMKTVPISEPGDKPPVKTKPKPKPAPKPAPRPSSAGTQNTQDPPIKYSHSVVAAPAVPRIFSEATEISIGEPIVLRAITRTHYRYRYLLGVPTQIRFTPIRYVWRMTDGKIANGKHLMARFSAPGQKIVHLLVRFSVAFRASSRGAWRKVVGSVYQTSVPLAIEVTNLGSTKRWRYVAFDCLTRPEGIGCRL